MNVIPSSYDQVSHFYIPPSTFCMNFRPPYTFHHRCISQQTDLKCPWDKIRSETYNLIIIILLLLLLLYVDSSRFRAMAFPATGVPRQIFTIWGWQLIYYHRTLNVQYCLPIIETCKLPLLNRQKKAIKSFYFSILPDFRKTMTSVERSTGFAPVSFYWVHSRMGMNKNLYGSTFLSNAPSYPIIIWRSQFHQIVLPTGEQY